MLKSEFGTGDFTSVIKEITMNYIKVKAYGKLNLSLNILSQLPNGYHIMDMVMQSVAVHDIITIKTKEETGIILNGSDGSINWDSSNLAYKACELFLKESGNLLTGVEIFVEKNLPAQAGMAGGSADCAGVLVGLNRIFGEPFSQKQLCEMGLTLGADLPFCIIGGTAHTGGIGEKITPIAPMPSCYIVIAKPTGGISTGEAFRAYHLNTPVNKPNNTELIKAIEKGSIEEMGRNAINVFQPNCPLPQIEEYIGVLKEGGASFALMTGTGSAVYGVFTHKDKAEATLEKLQKTADYTALTTPVNMGVEIIELNGGE